MRDARTYATARLKEQRSRYSVKKLTLIRNLVKPRRGTENEKKRTRRMKLKEGTRRGEGWPCRSRRGREVARRISLGREKIVKSGEACFIFVSFRKIASIHGVRQEHSFFFLFFPFFFFPPSSLLLPLRFFLFFLFSLFFFSQFARPGLEVRSGYAGETFSLSLSLALSSYPSVGFFETSGSPEEEAIEISKRSRPRDAIL